MNQTLRPVTRLVLLSIAAISVLLAVGWAAPFKGAPSAQAVDGASLHISKSCSPEAAVGGLVRYVFTLTNTGSVALEQDSVIDDPVFGNISADFPSDLVPGQSAKVTKFYIVQETDDRPLVNTVRATYHAADGTQVQGIGSCSVDVPHLTITKTLAVNADSTFTFTITNDGNVPLRRYRVIDNKLGEITSHFPFELGVDQTETVEIIVPGQRICDNEVTAVYQSVPRATTVTAKAKCTPGDFTIAKECVGVAVIGEDVTFKYTISNPAGGVALTRVSVTDTILTDISSDFPPTLNPGDTVVVELPYTVVGVPVTNTVTAVYKDDSTGTDVTREATATCATGQLLEIAKLNPDGSLWTTPVVTFHICAGDVVAAGCDPTSATFVRSVDLGNGNPNPALLLGLNAGIHTVCEVPPPNFTVEPSECQAVDIVAGTTTTVTFTNRPTDGGDGCTPGYWKNHLEQWGPTGFSTGDDFDTTFGVDLFDPDITLGEAIRAKGGGVKKLARHGTAALLSAAHPGVGYPYTVAEVKAFVQAGDVDPLVAANELGCPID